MRYAVKLAYDGTAFHGSQRQSGVPTVEAELLSALEKVGAIAGVETAGFAFAARTDRGVSALGNVAAFETDFRRGELLQALNGNMSDVWAWALAPRPNGFNPRHARRRTYKYILPSDGLSGHALQEALAPFVGENDFTSFARIEEGVNPVRRIDSITVRESGGFTEATFVGESFLWNQVRRILEAARRVATGDVSMKAVEAALARERDDFGVAPAEGLILVDVEYDFAFEKDPAAASMARMELSDRLGALRLRSRLYEEMSSF